MTQRSWIPSSSLLLPPTPPRERGAGTVFVHVDLQALLQPAGSALVPVRLVHRASSLQHSQPSGPGQRGRPCQPGRAVPCRGLGPGQGGPGRAAFSTRDSDGGAAPSGMHYPRCPGHPSALPASPPRGNAPGVGRPGAGRGKAGLPPPGRGTTRRRVKR